MTKKYLIVSAGPNGAGKSFFTDLILADVFNLNMKSYDGDVVIHKCWKDTDFNDYPYAVERAQDIFEKSQAEAIKNGDTFSFQTNFNTSGQSQILNKFKGYEFILIYFAVDSIDTLIDRVKYRHEVKKEHYVAPKEIKERYHKGVLQINEQHKKYDNVIILDVSKNIEIDVAKGLLHQIPVFQRIGNEKIKTDKPIVNDTILRLFPFINSIK